MLISKRKRIVQPDVGVGTITTGLGRGLIAAVNLHSGIVTNSVNGEVGVLTGTLPPLSSSSGLQGRLFDAGVYRFTKSNAPASTEAFTILVIQNYKANAASWQSALAFNNAFCLYVPTSAATKQLSVYATGGGLANLTAANAIVTGKNQTLVVTNNLTTYTAYIDDVIQSPTATSSSVGTWSAPVTLKIGGGEGTTDYSHSEIDLVLVWKRVLTRAEISSITDNPWQVFKPYQSFLPSFSSATAGALLTNAPSAIVSSTINLTTAIRFTLSSLAQTTVTNLLTTKISFIQSLDVISTINSSLSTNIKLTNVAQANVSLSNTLTTTIALACSAQATTTVNSELKKKPIYIQQRNHTYDYSGKGWFNSDIVDVKGLFDKDLIILANPAAQLSAINSSLATVTNNLSTNLRFNNSAVAQATVTNLITSKISLATNLNVQTTNNTVLTSAILLNNSSQANVVLTSNLSTAIPLVNIAQAVASVSSNVITKIALINTANNIATFNETLITNIPLSNNCLAQVSANENLSTAIKLTNNAQAVTLFNTVLNGNLVLFTNNALASSTFTETLTTGISLSNTAQSISNVINNVSTTIKLSSAFINNSLVNATLSGGAATLSINAIAQAISESSITTSIKLAAIANTQSSVLNDLSTSIYLNTNSIAQVILTGSITTGIALNTFTQAVTSANNTLEVNQGISLSSLLVNNSVYNINLQTAISLINNAYSISNFNSTLFSLSSSSIKRKYTILPEVRIYNVKAEQRGYNVEKE